MKPRLASCMVLVLGVIAWTGCGDSTKDMRAEIWPDPAPTGWPVSAKGVYAAAVRSGALQGCRSNFGGESAVTGPEPDPDSAQFGYMGDVNVASISDEGCTRSILNYNLHYWIEFAPEESQTLPVSAAERIGLRNGWDASCLLYSTTFTDGTSDMGVTADDCRRKNPYGTGAIGKGDPGDAYTYSDDPYADDPSTKTDGWLT